MLFSDWEKRCGFADVGEAVFFMAEKKTKTKEEATPSIVSAEDRSAEAADGGEIQESERAIEECDEQDDWEELKERVRVAKLLDGMIGKMEAKLTHQEFKPTVADYLKLLQIEKEVEEKELEGKPREITVTWVDPEETSAGE